MRDNDGIRPTWRFFDGAVSISFSMLLAVLLTGCTACDGAPLLGYLKMLTGWDDGVIITATLLLFPTSLAFYGGMIVFFAAKEFVEKRAMARGRREGRREERERIQRALEARGVPLTPEQAKILAADDEPE